MSKTTTTKFGCDRLSCGKEATDSKFPYEQGWQYVYNFEAKVMQEVLVGRDGADAAIEVKTIEVRDKHFCSQKCLIDFLTSITAKGQ